MQPPPVRKGPYLKTLKHVHTEQIARLQAKNQHECDLLDDIRNFTKQRSVIEKTYAEALLKTSSAYLNKKIPSIPDLRDEEEEERWNVWNVWRTVLEENEKLARARLAAVEVFQQQITGDIRIFRLAKLQASKKCLDQLQTVQKEVQISVQELDRHKKFYFEEEHMAHDARDKARDAEEKLKKKKGSIFSSLTSLQRSSVKFSSKKEVHEEKSTGARNDYLLALAIANAHQDRYFNVDLDNCLRVSSYLTSAESGSVITLEGDVYDKLKEYLTVLGRTELLTCSAAQNSFSKIRDQAQMLSRDYNVMCCVQYYPVLKQHIRYPFQACDGDHCTKITCDHGAASILSREAKKWATKIGKEIKVVRENQKRLFLLQQLKDAGHKSDPDDPNGPDLDIKIDELRENIRRAETEKAKAEGVIECLRDGSVNVDEWMQDIESLTTVLDIPRSGSSNSIRTDTSGEQHQQQQQQQQPDPYYDSESNEPNQRKDSRHSRHERHERHEKTPRESISTSIEPDPEEDIDAYIAAAQAESKAEQQSQQQQSTWEPWGDPTKVDWGDENAAQLPTSPPVTTAKVHRDSWPTEQGDGELGVTKCVALYSYTAQNPDELSILENEHLDLIGEGDGDGWVRARNYKGEEGYVPQNYVEGEGGSSGAGPLQPQISFSSVDYHIQDSKATDINDQDDLTTADESLPQHSEVAPISNGYPEIEDDVPAEITMAAAVTTTMSSGGTTPFINELRGDEPEGMFCRALYDYEATAPEELSFYEGQIIRVTRTIVHDEEDGWWEGEYDGLKGLFPAIVTEECNWDGEPINFPDDEDEELEEDEISDSGIDPPQYTPPEVPGHLLGQIAVEPTVDPTVDPSLQVSQIVVTQPTPVTEETDVPANQKPVKTSVSYNYKQPFEMELNSDQQQKYQTQFGEDGQPIVVIHEVPDVTVTVTEPDNEIVDGENGDEDADAGLEVAQIVITAATPMTEECKLPGEDGKEGDDEKEDVISSDPSTAEIPEESMPIEEATAVEEQEIEQFADFGNNEFISAEQQQEEQESVSETIPEAFNKSTTAPPDEPQLPSESIPSVSSQDSADTVQELPTPPPLPQSEIPTSKDSTPMFATCTTTTSTANKSSLEIEDDNHKLISPGDSHESPVTPEELTPENLAKLESLKDSLC